MRLSTFKNVSYALRKTFFLFFPCLTYLSLAFNDSESLASSFRSIEDSGLVLMVIFFFPLPEFPERLKGKKYAQQEKKDF